MRTFSERKRKAAHGREGVGNGITAYEDAPYLGQTNELTGGGARGESGRTEEMMRQDYLQWLIEQQYAEATQKMQIDRVEKVEEYYGSLDEHFAKGTYDTVIAALQYSTADERQNKPNPSKIPLGANANIRNNLQSYKNAVVRYRKFLNGDHSLNGSSVQERSKDVDAPSVSEESTKQRLHLERDMQEALRLNIQSLEPSLKIIDDGAERSVESGFIDITCDDGESIVVVELKAGKADSRAVAQVLGYMGDMQGEEERPVRGILVAHDFDQRTKSAARVVPTLKLKKYSIEFKFSDAD